MQLLLGVNCLFGLGMAALGRKRSGSPLPGHADGAELRTQRLQGVDRVR